MASLRIRRAIGFAAVLSLALSGVAAADTITADGDAVTSGTQTSVNLGDVEVGQTRLVDVDFVLACRSTGHVAAGSTLAVVLSGLIVPTGGWASASPGSIDVPATWPASGEACPTGATVTSTTPAHVEVTAPSTPGTNLEFDAFFAPDPDAGVVSNFIAISIMMNAVEPAPTESAPRLEGSWGRPLAEALPALVGRVGRTVPLKLDVTADGVEQGPAAIDAPTLSVAPLASCTVDAAAGTARDSGTFGWGDGTWQLNLKTGDLGGGCWRLAAQVDGATFATAIVQLEDGGVAVAAHRR